MHVGKSYRLPEFILWTRRRGYVLVAVSVATACAYELMGLRWIAMPWPVAALLGTAASFIVGFKNAQTYNRTMEAQHAWTTITSLSRYWGLACRDLPRGDHEFRGLIRRHLAWLTALRYEARARRVWETAAAPSNLEYRRKHFNVPEDESPLSDELSKFLLPDEIAKTETAHNRTSALLDAQSTVLRALYVSQDLAVLHHTEMQRTLKELLEQQSRVERIKNLPYPRQYAVINKILVWSFALFLPLCLVREFDRLNEFAQGALAGQMTWFTIPFGVLLGWIYLALDKVGESTENPFEGSANDVPITRTCRLIEAELRDLLGEKAQPRGETASPIVL